MNDQPRVVFSNSLQLIERTAMALVGRWRILEMELSDPDALDLVGPAFIEFGRDGTGSFGFIAVEGWVDCRHVEMDGRPGMEFTSDGTDEGDHVSGRGAATLQDDGSLHGHIYFHLGDDSGFRAARVPIAGVHVDGVNTHFGQGGSLSLRILLNAAQSSRVDQQDGPPPPLAELLQVIPLAVKSEQFAHEPSGYNNRRPGQNQDSDRR